MKNSSVTPVVLCGGTGSRLWPLSREHYPKQFIPLASDLSLLQETVERLDGVRAPLLVCNEQYRFLVAEQMRQCGKEVAGILLEPVARNTAPAIALAAHQIIEADADGILLVLPSDHLVPDRAAFLTAVEQAVGLAEQDHLVTMGIRPTRPETGYGYIKSGDAVLEGYAVEQFAEKPDLATATRYVDSGEYFWNSGMFVFSARQYLNELAMHRPEMASALSDCFATRDQDFDFIRIDAEAFTRCPSESIDYAVMENTGRAAMVEIDVGWSDIGAWDSLWEVSGKDDRGNVVRGDVMTENVNNSLIRAEHRLVSVAGLDDVVVVETADAVLVLSKNDAQSVKQIVARLNKDGRDETLTHQLVYRPWGAYESLGVGASFQVKRIEVSPGASLSLQMHHHRAEHWVVVSGVAQVTRGEEVFELKENESTFIPLGAKHRLANTTTEPLVIIEIQSGDYLGEDDIVRFEDNYGRS